MIWLEAARTRLRLLFRRRAAESRMEEEFRLHIDLEADKLAEAEGLSFEEARRRALIAFGGVEKHKEDVRDGRTLGWLSGASLDLKLAWRMLFRSPGLTIVGGLGIMVAVAIATGFFLYFQSTLYPDLKLNDDERIVALENWDVATNNEERRSLYDFAAWRENMRTVEQISAVRLLQTELTISDDIRPVPVAEMSASGFRVARVPPVLGRYLTEKDESQNSEHVVVIGYDLWQGRFEGDPNIVGQRIGIGDTSHTVIGVMPEGFAFPKNNSIWTALRVNPSQTQPVSGPEVFIFGRLAPGATTESAQAELTALGRRAEAESPETHELLRPQVLPYTYPLDHIVGMTLSQGATYQFLISLILVLVAVNVGVLVFARTARRRGEIAVRSALGASRLRIVGQLFLEALALAGIGGALGAAMGVFTIREGRKLMETLQPGELGYWHDYSLRPGTVLFVIGLTLLAATIIGIIPALRCTGKNLQSDIRNLGGATGIQLGAVWTVLIVLQVAVAVALLPIPVGAGWAALRGGVATRPTFPEEQFLNIDMVVASNPEARGSDTEARIDAPSHFESRLEELLRQLEMEPNVEGVTYRARLPDHSGIGEVEGMPSNELQSVEIYRSSSGVDIRYFDVYGATLLAGREFDRSDATGPPNGVIVSRSFVENVLKGGNAVGRRVRFVNDERGPEGAVALGQWYEIVGVVSDLASNPFNSRLVPAVVYYPVGGQQLTTASLAIRLRDGVTRDEFVPRLRALATMVDPGIRLDTQSGQPARVILFAVFVGVLCLGSVILLSGASIQSLMSFAVTRRQKEIGIRSALGSDPGRLLGSIFSRAILQLGLGVGLGALLGIALFVGEEQPLIAKVLTLATVGVVVFAIGALAALGPARRGMRIQPMEALRQE